MYRPQKYYKFRHRLIPMAAWLITAVAFAVFIVLIQSESTPPAPKESESLDLNWRDAYDLFRDNPTNDLAATQLRALAAQQPDDENAQFAYGIVERDTGHWSQAETIFKSIIHFNPNRAGALWNLGRLATRRGEFNQAVAYYEKSMQASPHAWQPVYALAQVKQIQGNADEARVLFQKAKSLGAGEPDRMGGMGGTKPTRSMRIQMMEWD